MSLLINSYALLIHCFTLLEKNICIIINTLDKLVNKKVVLDNY